MDVSNIYYTAPILDPCIEGDLLQAKRENKVTGKNIVKSFHKNIHQNYSVSMVEQSTEYQYHYLGGIAVTNPYEVEVYS